ncbi:hypothetical protein PAE9249_01057 [Paenibacillus sp. CECT 9249]|nr:hypothetical protein PAE9249_01057 [Paenibacillus sp. CECT 9249]
MMKLFKTMLISTLIISQLLMASAVSAEQADASQSAAEQTTANPQNEAKTDMTEEQAERPGETPVTEEAPDTEQTADPQETAGNGSATVDPAEAQEEQDLLILKANSDKMIHNGTEYTALQPLTVKDGNSYVALRSLAERVGINVSFDNSTKETVLQSGGHEIRFKMDSATYTVDGVKKKAHGPAYSQHNIFMVPLTTITQALNIPLTFNAETKEIILNLYSAPSAEFIVKTQDIRAEQTRVEYEDRSSHPRGLAIVEERWEGKEEIFQEPGLHVITRWVRDENGVWSKPYSVTVYVRPAKQPPVARFVTNQDTYRMGELISIQDQSTDEEDSIVERKWENKERAFFTPGQKTIKLKVTDKYGLSSEYEKTITITEETLYTRDDFNKLYTPVGEKYTFNGGSVLELPKIQFKSTDWGKVLLRSNSPESVTTEGVVYDDTINGDMRFLIHHKNISNQNLKFYVIATNPYDFDVAFGIEHVGFAGPNEFESITGQKSLQRYFESLQKGGVRQTVNLAPGESKLILTDLSARAAKPGQVVSMMADLYSDAPVRYRVVAVDESKDVMASLPYLTLLDRDGVHIRGTYQGSNRTISIAETIGDQPARMMLADKTDDPFLVGRDFMNGMDSVNLGNYGVYYTIYLEKVAPNTLISFNPRGGLYSGVFMVNGELVPAPESGNLNNRDEASVLYRTGSREEKVTIVFSPASGSNLPVNLLFYPLPDKKD